jgi:hypothetical protein
MHASGSRDGVSKRERAILLSAQAGQQAHWLRPKAARRNCEREDLIVDLAARFGHRDGHTR